MSTTKSGALVGRPPGKRKGNTPIIGVRFPAEETAKIQALIPEFGKTKSDVLRVLVRLGLEAVRRQKVRDKNRR